MAQFRLKAISAKGKIVQTEFEAGNKKEAQQKVNQLSKTNGLKIESIDKKAVFIYKVKRPGKKEWYGEQEAYSKEDLQRALAKLGYQVVSINKRLFNFQGRVPKMEVVSFIRLSADLLKQQLAYDEILTLLIEDSTNKTLKEAMKTIQKDLKEGKEGTQVYSKHEAIFGKFAAYMLGIASTSGNMALVFDSAAKFLEREAEFKKNLRRSLMIPSVSVIAIIGVVLFYVGYIFPVTAELFLEMDIKLPPMTTATLDMSYWLKGNWVYILIGFTAPITGFVYFLNTPKGRLTIDKYIIRIPVIGDVLHKTSLEIFARVFYTLYSSSGQNIEVMRIGAEACRNKYIEQQIKEIAIKKMLKDGAGLIESLEATRIFTITAINRFRLGAESGALRENAKQLAEYYETLTTYKMQSIIDIINLFINLFIAVALIAITIVSSEAAIINPSV